MTRTAMPRDEEGNIIREPKDELKIDAGEPETPLEEKNAYLQRKVEALEGSLSDLVDRMNVLSIRAGVKVESPDGFYDGYGTLSFDSEGNRITSWKRVSGSCRLNANGVAIDDQTYLITRENAEDIRCDYSQMYQIITGNKKSIMIPKYLTKRGKNMVPVRQYAMNDQISVVIGRVVDGQTLYDTEPITVTFSNINA